MNFADARTEMPRPGATTWYKGQRCTVLDTEDMQQPMVRVAFDDGRVAILKLSEIGLKASAVAAYLASRK